MTSEQKQRIMDMRDAGLGYIRIATSLALSVNIVKPLCQRNAKPKESKPQIIPIPKEKKPVYCK